MPQHNIHSTTDAILLSNEENCYNRLTFPHISCTSSTAYTPVTKTVLSNIRDAQEKVVSATKFYNSNNSKSYFSRYPTSRRELICLTVFIFT